MLSHSALSFCRGLAPSSGIGGTGAGSFGRFGSLGFSGGMFVTLQVSNLMMSDGSKHSFNDAGRPASELFLLSSINFSLVFGFWVLRLVREDALSPAVINFDDV